MYCSKCGNKQENGEKFCSQCGSPFVVDECQSTSEDDSAKNIAGGCFNLIAVLYILMIVVNATLSSDTDDFYKKVAKEYNLPLSMVRENMYSLTNHELSSFPIPKSYWYITLDNGTDVTVGRDFCGIISLKKDEIDKYFIFKEMRKELDKRNYPF